VNVFTETTLPNLTSLSLHESFGFKPAGIYRGLGYKINIWHDVAWWQLRLRKEQVPCELVSFQEARDRPAVRDTP
jgi:phosphinothricin acetyltransferase